MTMTEALSAASTLFRTPRAVLASIALGSLLVPLNSSMIAVALPDIMREWHTSVESAGWLVNSYLITMAIFQLIVGRLGDQWGRRRLVLGGLAYFGLASHAAALSPSLPILVFFRVQQGIAGASLVTNGIALAFQIVPAAQRGSNMGLINAAVVLGAAGGPLLGGVLVQTSGWHAIFWANVPVVIAALFLGWQAIPGGRDRSTTNTRTRSISQLQLVHRASFVCANAAIALSNLAMYVTLLAIPLLLSSGDGFTNLQTGLILGTMSVPMAFVSPLGGRLADRLGRRWPVVVGLSLFAGALLPLAWLGEDIAIALLCICLGCAGIGLGFSASALQTSALEAVAPQQTGLASGIALTSRYAGSIVGTTILTAFLGNPSMGSFKYVLGFTLLAALAATTISFGIPGGLPDREN